MSVGVKVGVTAIATAAMATSTLPLYGVSALGPVLVEDLDLSRQQLGWLVAVTISAAALLSMAAGRLIDRIGARRGLIGLTGAIVVTLFAASLANSYGWLLAALAVAGVGQALANPATNVLVRDRIPPPGDGLAIGYKQSGVQISALFSGLVLPRVASEHGWQWGLRTSAVAALVVAMMVPLVRASAAHVRSGRPRPFPLWLFRLTLYCFVLATANAAVAAYLPLFAVQGLRYQPSVGGAVLACFGAAGVFGRIWWARRAADRRDRPATMLTGLTCVAALCALPLTLATLPHLGMLVWVGALGVGGSATAAYAVAMLDVVRNAGNDTGRASGLVSVGFFLGFAAGPIAFGFLTGHAGYRAGWVGVVGMLVLAAAAALPFRRTAAPAAGC
jgi:predicted MFS family arabinose efflux permease